jgi:hypothetical protein
MAPTTWVYCKFKEKNVGFTGIGLVVPESANDSLK